ncbi:restriction endonuclease subunit S [Listeria welshimeri]|nr:restriction endonuclease subunit S [Listeria welshimeri]
MSHIKKYAPRRRFKKFSNADDWEQRKLEDILDVRSGRDYKHLDSGDIPVYGTGGYMLSVGEALSYEEDAIGIGRKGTIDKPYILKAPFWTVDTLFYTVSKRDSDLNFIHSIFQKINWKSKDESTGVPSLSKTTINAVSVFTPSCSEQKEIGTFFNKLDDTIALHQRKLEKIKALKTAYLSEMFPAEGETKPKRRFAGFTDDWEQRKLGDHAKYRRGSFPQPYGNKEWYDGEGAMPFVQVVDVTSKLTLVENTKQKISKLAQPKSVFVPKGKVIVTLQGSIGRVAITQYDSFVDRTLLIFDDYEKETDERFWAYTIQKKFEIEKLKAPGGTIKTITKEALSSFDVHLPQFEEQQKIGILFKQLDDTIALHQRKLQKLQNIKKAYLNEMFI